MGELWANEMRDKYGNLRLIGRRLGLRGKKAEPVPHNKTFHSPEISDLFRRYGTALKMFIFTSVKCEQTAEELSQETYVRVMRQAGKAPIEHLRAYLFRTATNLCTAVCRYKFYRVKVF